MNQRVRCFARLRVCPSRTHPWRRATALLATSVVALACDVTPSTPDDEGEPEQNTAPTAPVVSLAPARPVTTDDLTVSLVVAATDADNDTITYVYRWLKDGAVVDDVAGSSLPADRTTKGETWSVVVLADDGRAQSVPAQATVTIGNALPRATVTIAPIAPTRAAPLQAVTTLQDVDGDEITATYSWTVDGVPSSQAGDTLPASMLVRGQTVSVQVTPNDGDDDGDVVSTSVVVQNALPTIASVTLEPTEAADTTSEIVASITGVADDDGDNVVVRYRWLIDEVELTASTGSVLAPFSARAGQSVIVEVVPDDGVGLGIPLRSAPITIIDVPPFVTGARILPDTIRERSIASCAAEGFFDIDNDADASTVRWFVNDALVATGPAASTTMNGTVFGKGDRLQCELTARTNTPAASGNVVVSAIRTVENTPPVLASATPTVATAKKGDVIDIVTTGATDDDGDALTFEIAWLVENTERVRGSPVSANLFAKGESVVAVVRAFDGAQRSDAVTTTPVAIQNTAPTLSGARIVLPVDETTATKATTLVAAADGASDVDGDTVTTSFSWRTGGVVVGTDASLPPTAFARGDVVTLTAVPFDGEESGHQVTSTSLTIGNARPSAPSITVTPAQPTDTDTLRCAVTTGSTDLDNDAVRYAIAWTKDGASTAFSATNQVVGSELTVPDSATAVGETWTCTVTADDGNGGTRATTRSLTIGSTVCSAVSLNGSAHGSVADHPSLSLGSDDFTIEFYVRKASNTVAENYIGHDEGGGTTNKWIVTVGQTPQTSAFVLHFHVTSRGYGGRWLVQRPVSLAANVWNHIAVVRRAQLLTLFVNGRSSGSEAFTEAMPDPQAPLTLGQAEGGGFVNGAFSEVRLSRVARYVDDFVPSTRFVSDSDTITLYHLDEPSGATAADSGPNGLPMTFTPGASRTTNTSMCTQRETATTATFLVANTNLRGNARPSSIERVDVHNGQVAAIATLVSPANSGLIDQPRGLDVDAASRQFFVKQATGAITRGNVDGSGYAPIATSDVNGVGIDVDEASGRLLWSDGAGLLRAALDGSDQQRVIVGGAPVGVFVDEVGDRIFWHDISTQTIRRAFRDGGGQTTVTTGAIEVHGLALDSTTNTLWFADAGAHAIKKVNADGGTSVIVTTSTTSPTDLVLDVPHGFVYWTESRANQSVGLLRATVAGTDVVVLTRDLGTPFGLARLPQP